MEASLFALVSVDDELAVFAYGMEIADGDKTDVVIYRRDPESRKTMFGLHESVARAVRFCSRHAQVKVLWLEDELDQRAEPA
ncbi:MAG: hypothetical protein ABWY11_26795 [Umezawaea sp.]|uniref:Uncharacterized protein n=1 Tax=Umezawaea tangerina TaxID=84725 RepID=A0A2T0TJU1_9PSEU|nr:MULTISPECIES: hypothetical protein [Umezawaea]PRY45984.1 hypothetical protein CLV43_101248 [Umezawaea tangerina]WNV91517.1 hypothetical protein RM788_25640 [Umezawaea sp. Da 62-37]